MDVLTVGIRRWRFGLRRRLSSQASLLRALATDLGLESWDPLDVIASRRAGSLLNYLPLLECLTASRGKQSTTSLSQ